jgi:DtxR family Mn-dependent transcriptional regulator
MAEQGSVSPSVEDYAKAVYVLETRTGGAVSTNTLAERLEITPGSASGMVRKLADQGLVEHERYRGVRLTDAGRTLALSVIRRHRLIEQFSSPRRSGCRGTASTTRRRCSSTCSPASSNG